MKSSGICFIIEEVKKSCWPANYWLGKEAGCNQKKCYLQLCLLRVPYDLISLKSRKVSSLSYMFADIFFINLN